jgi:DNA repair exonuclease SbcCD ATPase subunit
MQFSGADIVVLAIVGIVLFIYRQLDRNKRSLEKVKRYTTRVQEELETHVQDKVVAIKDMGIELEVHQKAAREVLKRVQAIESGLSDRAEEIDRIGSRIGEYDAALDELVQMTKRAQENINRIREESSYVDSVGRRLKQSQDRLVAVEKGLELIVDRFRTENEKRLTTAQDQVIKDADGKVDSVRDELARFQERVNQFGEYVRGSEERAQAVSDRTQTELEEIAMTVVHRAQEVSIQSSEQLSEMREQLQTVERDFQKRLTELAERGETMQTSALANLSDRIDAAAQEVARELTSRLEHQKRALQDRVDAAIVEVQESEAKLAERDRKLEESRSEIDRRIHGFTTDLHERVHRAAEEAQQRIIGEIESRLTEYESQITYRFEKLGDVGHEVEQLGTRLQDSMDQITSKVHVEFTRFTDDFRESRMKDRNAVQAEMKILREGMAQLDSGLTELKNQAYENVNAKLQVFEDEFFADLKTRQVAMEQRLIDWQAAFQEQLDQVSFSARDERQQMEAEYSSKVRAQLESLHTTAQTRYQQLQEEIVEFQRGIELRVSDSRELVASLEREVQQELHTLAAEAGARAEFDEHRDQVTAEVRELERTVRQQMDELARSLEAGRSQLGETLETSRGEAAAWKDQVDHRLQNTTAEVNQQIADFRVSIGEMLAGLRDSFSTERDLAL